MVKGATDTQKKVFSYLVDYRNKHGFFPSIREVAAHFGLSSTFSIEKAVRALEKKGFLRRIPGRSRAYEILNDFAETAGEVLVPFLGVAQAGMPVLSFDEVSGYMAFGPSVIQGKNPCIIEIKGDSMKDEHIREGDYALCIPLQGSDPPDGKIIVALVDGEATLKRYLRKQGRHYLMPANPAYEPIEITKDSKVRLMGTVIAVIRQIDRRFDMFRR